MKYVVFIAVSSCLLPTVAYLAMRSNLWRSWLLSALVFSTAAGDLSNIFFISMENYRGPDRGFEFTLSDLICWGLVLALVTQSFHHARLGRYDSIWFKIKWLPFGSFWMFAFFFASCLSTVDAPNALFASFTLFKLIKIYLLYWCIVNCVRITECQRPLFYGFVAIGFFIAAIAFYQKYGHGIYRVSGPFDHSNTIPPYLNQIIPLVLIWTSCYRNLNRFDVLLGVVSSLGMVFSVVATFSRAGVALMGLSLLSVLIFVLWRDRTPRAYAISALLSLTITAGALKATDSFLDRIQNAPKASEDARDEFNRAAEMMLRDHFWGIGLNNFSYVLTHNEKYNAHMYVLANEETAGVCHHIYLLTAAETGYPGLILFLIIISIFVLRSGWYTLRYNTVEGNLLFGIVAGFCSLHVSGFLEWALRITPVFYLFIIQCGLSTAYIESLRERAVEIQTAIRNQ